jgi:predicted transcriptional regulator
MKLPIVVVTRVSESMKHELRRAAEAEDRTVCAFIRLAIRDALARRARARVSHDEHDRTTG